MTNTRKFIKNGQLNWMIKIMTALSGNINKNNYNIHIPTTVSVTPTKLFNSTAAEKSFLTSVVF